MSIQEAVARSRLFSPLDRERQQRVAALGRRQYYRRGELILRQGDPIADLFVVEAGKVQLAMGVRLWGQEAVLRSIVEDLEVGATFGWSALVEPHVATLSAEALVPTRVVAFNGALLQRLLEQDPILGYRVMSALARLVAGRLEATRMSIMSARARDASRVSTPGLF